MISGGNATVFVSNMDAAVTFYSEGLGLELRERYGNEWATVVAGGFTIGLHPQSEKNAAPGTTGSIMIGLSVDEPIEAAMDKLGRCGAKELESVVRTPAGNFAHFKDPDGNQLYLWEAPKW